MYDRVQPIRRLQLFLLLSAALLWNGQAARAQTQGTLSYTDVLHQLTDLDRLTRLQTGTRGGLFSSWDRNSKTVWGANGDAGQYLRIEPNGEAVMMDIDGPGIIYRVWSANPVGKLRIYLDGAEKPSYEWNFPDLFDGKLPPFIQPLVYRRDSAQSASDCYLPIPFAKHIKICADKKHIEYYHFNYVLLPKGQSVASFRLPLNAEEQSALSAAAEAWSNSGKDPKPKLDGQQTISKKVTIAPGQTVSLCKLDNAGMIRAVRARVDSKQRYAWRKLVLRGTWDGAAWPQVLTPLGPFFGFDWETAEYGSVPVGCRKGLAYQYYSMPFRKSASLELTNYLEAPADVEYEIEWAPQSQLPADTAYFFARWRHEPGSRTFDYPFLETAGHGHFVGVSMPIDHPLGGWWGEGDEKVWVDDDDFSPYIGTGSEDYFGDAWGIRYLSGPSFGASSMKGHRTCNYRWHFMDFIPFNQRMRMTIENYGPNGQGPRGQYEYNSTVFWYQAELTPPFEKLRGVRYTGGNEPLGPPAPMQYSDSPFADVGADQVRTFGLGIIFSQQAETLLADTIQAGGATLVTDAMRPYEFDRERAVDFGTVAAGKKLGKFKIAVDADGVYDVQLYTAPEEKIADLTLDVDGKKLDVAKHAPPSVLQLQSVFLTKGEHVVDLAAATGGRAILDCIKVQPVARFSEAIEAEEQKIAGATGQGTPPRPSEPVTGVSAGRVLEFHAEKAGQGYLLHFEKRPAMPYVLGVRPLLGPRAARIQGFVDGKPIGPEFDLYAAERGLGPAVLPLGSVPANAKDVEVRVVGHNEKSQGFDADLDYLRWEPSILGEGTAGGIWARVAGMDRCEYRPQDLGPGYSGGHQFWVQPCDLNGWVDIALEIPRDGSYEIVAKYTKSWDYANIQAFMDGKPIGAVADTFSSEVVPAEPVSLGKLELKAGTHVLRFKAVGHNPESKGYLMGIDHVIIK